MPHVAQRRARFHLADAGQHRLVGRVDQLPRHRARLADAIHAARIAEIAILDHGHVDIDDVAVLQDFGPAWDAVADHLVHRRTNRLRKAQVADIRRNRLLRIDDVVVAQRVEVVRRYAGTHVFADHREHVGGKPSGYAQRRNIVGSLVCNGHEIKGGW